MLTVVLALLGCTPGLQDARTPTGSSTLATDARFESVYAVNVDEGTVSRLEDGRVVDEIVVGGEPTRIARAGIGLFVTLRTERSVVVIEGDEVVDRIEVGTEPVGIVADESGQRLFVAASLDGEVVEIDAGTLEVGRRFPAPDEPRWLALHPSGRSLYVGSVHGGTLSRIVLKSGEVEQLVLPQTERETALSDRVILSTRITGDLAVTPDGTALAAPSIIVDNTTPVEEPEPGQEDGGGGGGYASSGVGISRVNPAVLLYELGRQGQIQGEGTPLFLATGGDREIVRSYPSSVTAVPNSKLFAVTMEASNAVAVVGRIPFPDDRANGVADTGGMGFTSPTDAGFAQYPRAVIQTGLGPRGVVFTSDTRAFVHTFLDRRIADLNYKRAQDHVQGVAREGFVSEFAELTADAGRQLAEPSLTPAVERGRKLFYSAVDGRMASEGAGISCSTCHFDGRTDGLTWTFEKGLRQTPSLAGTVSETAPVTWTDEVESVSAEAELTSQTRMGGDGIGHQELADIEAYVDWSRRVQAPPRDTDLIALGAEVFQRPEVGCAECHAGDRFTDNKAYELFGIEANTPSLTGVIATAPYFHNGSAADLETVLEFARLGMMGDASMLTDREMDGLLAYLETL